MKRFFCGALALCLTLGMADAQVKEGKTHSGRGTGQPPFPIETYQELSNPVATDVNLWKEVAGVKVSWGSIDKRYKKELPVEGELVQEQRLVAWRGERVSAQFVVWSGRPVEKLSFEVTSLKKANGRSKIGSDQVLKGFVRYVMTDELNKDGRGGCGNRPDPTVYDSTLVADPIDHLTKTLALNENSTQGCWVRVAVPEEADPGVYSGKVVVRDGKKVLSNLSLVVEVKNHRLPKVADWKYHLDLWQNPFAIARYHQVKPWSKEHLKVMKPYMELYRDAGGKVVTASIMHKPWDGQTYDYFESMVDWVKKRDGSWAFDYTVFDRWVQFMLDLGIDKQINCYSMIPWNLTFRYFDEATNSTRYIASRPGEPAYNEVWTAMLKSFVQHLKEKGWFERTSIAMDERPMDQMLQVIELIKGVDANFKISFAGNMHEELMGVLDDYSVPLSFKYPDETLARRKEAGKVSTFYTCCVEPYPNTFTFCEPADAEWLGWYTAKNQLDGYLRWALNSWVIEPLLDSRFYTWAAGDTYLIYPGARTSIRFERLTAGVQAFEKVRILRKEFTRMGDEASLKILNDALAEFEEYRLPDVSSASMVANANEVVNALTDQMETRINPTQADGISVRGEKGMLLIEGVPSNAQVQVYHTDGTLVADCTVSKEAMPLPANRVYIVQIGANSYKVSL